MGDVKITKKATIDERKTRAEQVRIIKESRRTQVKNLAPDSLTTLAQMREAIKIIQEYLFSDDDAKDIVESKEKKR